MSRRILIFALTLLVAGIAAADKPAAIELGFKPEKVYAFDALDNVNLFNGNLIYTIPIGMKYPVSSNLSYGLTLVYNAKAWDYFYVESAARPDDIRAWAKPNIRSNAGMGWRVSLGRLIPPSDYTSTSGYAEIESAAWVYESPAGDEHNVAGRGSTATVSASYDGASLRMVVVNTTTRQVQFPNGEIHTFNYERNAWRLKKMEDAFGNAVNVAYTYMSTTSDLTSAWTISDAFSRSHTVNFVTSPYMTDSIDRGMTVSSIVMRGYGTGMNVTYTFNYNSAASVAYGCEHNMSTTDTNFNPRPSSTTATVPLLTSVTLPDGSAWSFNYYYLGDNTGGVCSSGLLKEVTLPTLGKMSYTWQKYDIPANDWCTLAGPSTSSGGVATRTIDGKVWTYKQTVGPIAINYTADSSMRYTCGSNQIDGEQAQYFPQHARRWKRTSVIAPADSGFTRSDHYFSIWRNMHAEQDTAFGAHQTTFDYGYPSTSAWPGATAAQAAPQTWEPASDTSGADVSTDAAPRYLMDQTWSSCTATGDCRTVASAGAKLLQSKYARYTFFGILRHPSAERTVYNDDTTCSTGTCYTQTDYSDHNGAGKLRQTVESSNFRGDTTATNRTEYETWTSTGMNNAAVKWVTGRYTEKKRTIGTKTARTLYCFGSSGELLRTRALTNTTVESSTDVIETYSYTNGNVNSIKTYGGDHAARAMPTGVTLCSVDLSLKTPQYENQYVWASGGLTREWAVDTATGYGLLFNSRDYSRNSGTGLVTQSRATDGLPTGYTYTAWGAIASVTPPGEIQTTYTYAKATPTTPATVTATHGDETVVWEYDVMGRLAREQKTLPGAGCVKRLLTYNAHGRVASETSWHGCTATSPGSTTWTYDAVGRAISVKSPDNKTSTTTYRGARIIERTSPDVALVGAAASVTTSEEYDRFGRLIEVKESVAPAAQLQTTSYTYDAADRLTGVTMGTQTRVFTYDGRGFLTSEQHPELNNGTTRYREYDARGHAWRKTTGTDLGVFDIRMTWDPAERVTLVTRASDGRKLKELLYDDPNDVYCGGQICRGKLAAAARYHWDSDLSNVAGGEALAVTESYKYDITTGRATRRDRAIGNTSLFTGNSFYTLQAHNTSGQLASISYPCSDYAGCPGGGVQRVVSFGYTNGALTSVGNYAPSITYAPSGIIDTVTHGTSGAAGLEVWTRDPYGMARPLNITAKTTANVTRWTSGNYGYDGSGNIRSIGGLSYNYDALGRLVRWTTNNADGTSVWSGREYDRFGNPLYNTSGTCGAGGIGCTSTNGVARTITGTTNRYADTTYDAAGNVTADPNRSFLYDGVGMMTRATFVSPTATRHMRYLYSVDDERIAAVERVTVSGVVKNKTTYTIRGFANQLLGVWVTDPNTNAATWVEDEIWRGSALLARESAAKGTTHYFLDHLGSPRAITNTAGTLLGTQTFDPWGNGGTADGGALQFTAHERDAATFGSGSTAFPDYMHARYYDVPGGRFLAMDPGKDWDFRQPQSWNGYAYVRNNPVTKTDPTGKWVLDAAWDAGNILIGARSLATNIAVGNYGAAAVDVVGIAFDTASLLSPTPGGAGTAIKLARGADNAKDAFQAADKGRRLLPFKDADRLTEVNNTLDRIEAGVKKYKQDGTEWKNKNGDLPEKPAGYYKEYTVDTPGATHRAKRRIVQGERGETYYSDDHYHTFTRIDPQSHR